MDPRGRRNDPEQLAEPELAVKVSVDVRVQHRPEPTSADAPRGALHADVRAR